MKDTKGHTLHDSYFMKCPEETEGLVINQGEEETGVNSYWVSFME